MPTYEYECRRCGYSFEHFHSISEAGPGNCPVCGGPVKQIITGGTGFIFRGGTPPGKACGYEHTGETCCGRGEPCDKRHCHDR
ncbi:FmdB family zinc ribbon protein [Thermodesulforhabdus norvegica]|uniref:Putative regulatory protein, FmdB family n=1 Tax=Thermodesulforhabdus norvegica TaxID=39841 RepID=A0A1I4VSV8_9BACT|nr:zinc ribbon domain-containing protein [Thermodesulforhabdus norvegica]SFN04242.1 putative regulatory protein, FmdB family [Thermodesulforhabdus norvegica]